MLNALDHFPSSSSPWIYDIDAGRLKWRRVTGCHHETMRGGDGGNIPIWQGKGFARDFCLRRPFGIAAGSGLIEG